MNYLTALMATKAGKVGGAVVAGGSSLALVANLIMGKITDVDHRIDDQAKSTREYVDIKHDTVMIEIKHIAESQIEIKDMLKIIERRQYNERNK